MITAPRELQTARLLLRSFANEDVPDLVRLAGAPEVAATTLQIPHPYTELDACNFLAHAGEDHDSGRSVIFAICVASGGALCGGIGLHLVPIHQRAELGYWIGVPYWGKGYATEAARAVAAFGFDALRLHRIHAQHFSGNTASQRVLEKIGMKYEGRYRQHIQKWERFIDVENYGILAEEYRNRVAK